MTAGYGKTAPGRALEVSHKVIISRKGESMKDLNEESMKDLNEIMCDELMDAFTLYLVTYPERDEITLSEYYRLRRFWKQAAAISAELIVKHIGALA